MAEAQVKEVKELARVAALKAMSQHFCYYWIKNANELKGRTRIRLKAEKNDRKCPLCIPIPTRRFLQPPDYLHEFILEQIEKSYHSLHEEEEWSLKLAQKLVHSWIDQHVVEAVSMKRRGYYNPFK
jgi:hypothetical protein